MLILYEVKQLRGICLAQEVEGAHLQTRRETIDDLECLVRPKRLLEDVLRILQTTRGDVILCHAHGVKLCNNLRLERSGNLLLVRDLERQVLDLIVIHMLEQLCRVFRSDGDEEDRRFLLIGQLIAAIHIRHTYSSSESHVLTRSATSSGLASMSARRACR